MSTWIKDIWRWWWRGRVAAQLQRTATDPVLRPLLLRALIPPTVGEAAERDDLLVWLREAGIDAYPHREGHGYFQVAPGTHYVPDFYGPSAHKQADLRTLPEFGPLAREVIEQGATLLYYDRLYTLYQGVQFVRQRAAPGADLAEVGVYKGGSACFMARLLRQWGLAGAVLHGFDTFQGHAAVDVRPAIEPQHPAGFFGDTSFEAVQARLAALPHVRLHRGRVQDTAAAVADRRFALVHLDVDIYEPMTFSLDFFGPRLVPGGWIIVDDYGFLTCPGVAMAVDPFIQQHPEFLRIILLTGQCLLVKT